MRPTDADPSTYAAQLEAKHARLSALFAPFGVPSIEVFESPPLHFRMRAEFRVWHDGEDLYHIMFDPGTKEPYRVDRLPTASRLINDLMPAMVTAVRANETLRRKLFQIDYLSTLSGEAVASLLYHRPLDDEWRVAATTLRADLRDQGFAVELIGRARKTKICINRDYATESLECHGRRYAQRQFENSFTQPNAAVAQRMLEWAVDCTRNSDGDLLELYCGNGNFSLALAQNFRRVLATEVSKTSVQAAQHNIAANGISNLAVVRLSASEIAEAIAGVRPFRRLQRAGVDLPNHRFSTVFVDPPRAGLDAEGCAMVQRFDRILYISCNPTTLRANLEILNRTHAVVRCALFDQFPYTDHIESGVLLVRR
ncbi:MAG: tRNA (uridine(54)-C5)-methyltransferase TrmA [Myxococcota bacterium]|nr:tRNA (uridine(54)-C5)-methyltransferase TrmA [Myxococcota bacterium]